MQSGASGGPKTVIDCSADERVQKPENPTHIVARGRDNSRKRGPLQGIERIDELSDGGGIVQGRGGDQRASRH